MIAQLEAPDSVSFLFHEFLWQFEQTFLIWFHFWIGMFSRRCQNHSPCVLQASSRGCLAGVGRPSWTPPRSFQVKLWQINAMAVDCCFLCLPVLLNTTSSKRIYHELWPKLTKRVPTANFFTLQDSQVSKIAFRMFGAWYSHGARQKQGAATCFSTGIDVFLEISLPKWSGPFFETITMHASPCDCMHQPTKLKSRLPTPRLGMEPAIFGPDKWTNGIKV